MTRTDWIALVAAAAAALLLVAAVVLGRALRALAARLERAEADLDRMRREMVPLLADTRAALRRAEHANHRTDALLDTATSVTETVDAATRLAHRVVTNPVVKVLSLATGTRRAARRLAASTIPPPPAPPLPSSRGRDAMGVAEAQAALRAADTRPELPGAAGSDRRRGRRRR